VAAGVLLGVTTLGDGAGSCETVGEGDGAGSGAGDGGNVGTGSGTALLSSVAISSIALLVSEPHFKVGSGGGFFKIEMISEVA